MSSFRNLFFPAIGATGLALGGAYGIATNSLRNAEVETADRAIVAAAERAKLAEASAMELASELETASAPISTGDPVPEGVVYALGRVALPEEVVAWDIDVRPDGMGLPEGRGNALDGEEVFAEKCASCHGDFGEGVDRWPVLAGGIESLTDDRPVKTIGSYWPYLSTVFDYVNRAMPFGDARSLEPDEVYAITAYLLYLNDQVDEDFELSHENFKDIRLPNEVNFYPDDRATLELAQFSVEPCMSDCKETVEITMRAAVLNVTPEETVEPTLVASPDTPTPVETDASGPDPALLAAGEKAFKKCKACHQVGTGAKNKAGPMLNGIVGSPIARLDGFKYSSAFKAKADEGFVWTDEALAEFLAKPKAYIKGTKMSFSGFKKDEDIQAIITFLKAQTN